jgi:hypothetical protein
MSVLPCLLAPDRLARSAAAVNVQAGDVQAGDVQAGNLSTRLNRLAGPGTMRGILRGTKEQQDG